MRLDLHRLARGDYAKASNYFFSDGGLFKYDRFRRAVDAAFASIRANPLVGSPCQEDCRWLVAKPFRHIVYYRVESDKLITVYAVAHASRRPGYWLRRTRRP